MHNPNRILFTGDENVIYIENDHIRLGVNLDLGGAVTYLSEHGRKNLINSFDWGRQVQMSFYGHPVPFEPEGHELSDHWKGLGWNPIQSGDFFGNRSRIVDHRETEDEIYVKCIPMHWPLDNYPGECTFEVWYRLNGTRVDVTARLNNARPDTNKYPARPTELPAVYTNGEWYKLVSYVGNKPFTGDAHSELCTKENGLGWPWIGYRATEYWSALVDDDNYGLGCYNDGSTRYVGGFYGEKGSGGPKDAPTGYFCPEILEVLDHNIVYTYTYSLIVGELSHIRAEANELYRQSPRNFDRYDFSVSRDHFTYVNITDDGWPVPGCLNFDFSAGSALRSPSFFRKAGDLTRLVIDAEISGGDIPVTVTLSLYDSMGHARSYVYPTQEISGCICGDGARKNHLLDLSALSEDCIDFTITFHAPGHAKVYSITME